MSQARHTGYDLKARLTACALRHGLFPAIPGEIEQGREIAVRLIGPLIAPVNVFAAIQERCGAAVFVYRQNGEAQGFLAMIPLRSSGLAKLKADSFDALDPALEDVCLEDETPAAVYAWGLAATTVRASAAVVRALMALRDEALPQVPFFCRAATAQGAKVIHGKLGYEP